jgi:hypothetical protein
MAYTTDDEYRAQLVQYFKTEHTKEMVPMIDRLYADNKAVLDPVIQRIVTEMNFENNDMNVFYLFSYDYFHETRSLLKNYQPRT